MKLSELKNHLQEIPEIKFELPNGQFVPPHFHVTEMGQIIKKFIDCGGTIRHDEAISFQLLDSNDTNHRLSPEKLSKIIILSEKQLKLEDSDIEVEYQGDTIGKYNLSFTGKHFLLVAKNTACLASDNCGSGQKQRVSLSELQTTKKCC